MVMVVVIVLVTVVVVVVVGVMDLIVFVEVLVMVVVYKTYFCKDTPLQLFERENILLWGDKFSFWSSRRNVLTTIKFVRKDSFGNCLLLFVFAFCWLVLLHFLAHPFCKLPIFDEN